MEQQFAIKARDLTLDALQKLHAIVIMEADWSTEGMQEFRRTLGKSIGIIDFDILCSIYKHFPDLNDLSDKEISQD